MSTIQITGKTIANGCIDIGHTLIKDGKPVDISTVVMQDLDDDTIRYHVSLTGEELDRLIKFRQQSIAKS